MVAAIIVVTLWYRQRNTHVATTLAESAQIGWREFLNRWSLANRLHVFNFRFNRFSTLAVFPNNRPLWPLR